MIGGLEAAYSKRIVTGARRDRVGERFVRVTPASGGVTRGS